MDFDEWTTEARRSLQAWDPDPAVRPEATMPRVGDGSADGSAADPEAAPGYVELAPAGSPPPTRKRRRLLTAAAAAIVVAAGAVAVLTIPRDGDDVTVRPQSDSTGPMAPATTTPADPGAANGPRFDCSASDPNGTPVPTSTDVFDDQAEVATWQAKDPDAPEAGSNTSASTGGPAIYVNGTLTQQRGDDLTATRARGAAFVADLAPAWTCTVWSPVIDVADPSRPGAIVGEHGVVTNRLGGMCFVPDASADPDATWGIDPDLASKLDAIEGLTDWSVILADGGGNGQGPGRLWMEFTYEADPSVVNGPDTIRITGAVTVAAVKAGESAGVTGECTTH